MVKIDVNKFTDDFEIKNITIIPLSDNKNEFLKDDKGGLCGRWVKNGDFKCSHYVNDDTSNCSAKTNELVSYWRHVLVFLLIFIVFLLLIYMLLALLRKELSNLKNSVINIISKIIFYVTARRYQFHVIPNLFTKLAKVRGLTCINH